MTKELMRLCKILGYFVYRRADARHYGASEDEINELTKAIQRISHLMKVERMRVKYELSA